MTDAEWRIEDLRLRNEYAEQYARDLEQRARHEAAQQVRHDADMAQRAEDRALREQHEAAYQLRHEQAQAWAREKEAAEKARHEQSQEALTRQFELLMNPPPAPPSAEAVALEKIAEKVTLMAEAIYTHLQKGAL